MLGKTRRAPDDALNETRLLHVTQRGSRAATPTIIRHFPNSLPPQKKCRSLDYSGQHAGDLHPPPLGLSLLSLRRHDDFFIPRPSSSVPRPEYYSSTTARRRSSVLTRRHLQPTHSHHTSRSLHHHHRPQSLPSSHPVTRRHHHSFPQSSNQSRSKTPTSKSPVTTPPSLARMTKFGS